ncbi:hypothetical protein [Saccharothrix sp. HUAS TT1]|uniref:hypothetical protein n=1 Tax=unclassified Saccharothrix TaxID=2593673 RepID=UPI00345BD42F
MTDQQHDDEPQQEYAALLVQADKGRVHERASEQLTALLKAVRATGKGGSLTVKFDIKPDKGSDGERVTVAGSVAAKVPAPDAKTSIFFVDEDGGLHRNDPHQQSLFQDQERTQR